MGAGMGSLVLDAVVVNVLMCLGTHALVSCFAAKSKILQLWQYLYGCYDRGCARDMKALRANRGG